MRLLLASALLCVALPAAAQDSRPAPTPEPPVAPGREPGAPITDQRAELATAVVVGDVLDVYSNKSACVLRVSVDRVEKGKLRRGATIFVRTATTKLRAKQRVRLYLAGNRRQGWDLEPGCAEVVTPQSGPVRSPRGDLAKLDELVNKLVESAKVNDWKAFATHAKTLRLPKPKAYFAQVFGAGPGARVAAEYEEQSKSLIVDLRKTFEALFAEGAGPHQVFEAVGYRATGLQRRARFAMHVDVPLYTLRFPRAGITVWSLASVRGEWRWLGKLQALPREPLVLRVKLSNPRVDTTKLADYTLRITIKNASEEVVEIPTRYDGRVIRLYGRGLEHMWASKLEVADPPTQAYAPLKPKEERTLLEVSLDRVFTLSDPDLRWDWGGHPVPPLSPIHQWRKLGFQQVAYFYVATEAGARTLHSPPIRALIVGN